MDSSTVRHIVVVLTGFDVRMGGEYPIYDDDMKLALGLAVAASVFLTGIFLLRD